ncbi:SapC family protein [Spiribacter pallidus]|uniref:SapC family protein n=1 Tax=Spiribacter pallidus TaxID=1987936 RepID=UPI00349FDB60
MAELLFYNEPVALNREEHKTMKVSAPKDFGFTRETNSVVLTGIEFAKACRHFPIVFTRNADQVIPVAVLGMRDNENLFVDSEGQWQANYIPAYIRRYPFVLANRGEDQGQFLICVENSALRKRGGEALFTKDGEETEYLQNATRFMQEYHQSFLRTVEFGRKLDELGLFQEMNARVTRDDDSSVVLGQFLSVNEDALMKLPAAAADELFRAGYLGWIYAHLISMDLFPELARLMGKDEETA